MYQPETEDMIPRCAPKPSMSDLNAVIPRPSVPEVSIVFSQSDSLAANATPPSATTSYAAWKKQCLPKPIYPVTTESSNTEMPPISTRSNVYPMRNVIQPTIDLTTSQYPFSKSQLTNYTRRSVGGSAQPPVESPATLCVQTPKLEQPNNILRNASTSIPSPCSTINSPTHCHANCMATRQCCEANQHRQSLDPTYIEKISRNSDVLTICAGTQTDSLPTNETSDFYKSFQTSKEDIAEMKSVLIEMATEQRRLMEMMHHFFLLHDNARLNSAKDVAVQYEEEPFVVSETPKRAKYDLIEEEGSEKQENHVLLKKPNAIIHSSTQNHQYQADVFRTIRSDVISGLPKPATEKSMVMNELALKYLPNEKLIDLFQELQISKVMPQAQNGQNLYSDVPLKNIENYGKGPNDLSTASYKYLKKYRLLPEELNNASPLENEKRIRNANDQENVLDLETIRRQPKFL